MCRRFVYIRRDGTKLIHYGIGTVPVSGGREMQWVWREGRPRARWRRAGLQWREKICYFPVYYGNYIDCCIREKLSYP